MIGMDDLVTRIAGLRQGDLDFWIANDWVRPDSVAGSHMFREIDVARVQLIVELRSEMEIDDASLPVVLSLLDQLYELRRHVAALRHAIAETVPDETLTKLMTRLREPASVIKL